MSPLNEDIKNKLGREIYPGLYLMFRSNNFAEQDSIDENSSVKWLQRLLKNDI